MSDKDKKPKEDEPGFQPLDGGHGDPPPPPPPPPPKDVDEG